MDVLKDRLYCDAADSLSRRSAQTVMYRILDSLVRMLAPILVHTAEEAWAAMKFKSEKVETVHIASMPEVDDSIDYQGDEPQWQKLMELRDEVLRVLEGLRQEKKIASNQEAAVKIRTADRNLVSLIKDQITEKEFAALCIVSEVEIALFSGNLNEGGEDVANEMPNDINAKKSEHQKCQRCWNYWPSVGADGEHPDLCKRCIEVI